MLLLMSMTVSFADKSTVDIDMTVSLADNATVNIDDCVIC